MAVINKIIDSVIPKKVPKLKDVPKFKRHSTKGKDTTTILDERIGDIKKDRQMAGFESRIRKETPLPEKKEILDIPDDVTPKKRVRLEKSNEKKVIFNEKLPELHERIKQKKRDLYLKANTLKQELRLAELVKEGKANGVSAEDTVLDSISYRQGLGSKFSNIEGRDRAIYNDISADIYELKDSLRTKNFGLSQDTDMADDVIRYIKDGKVKNPKNLETVKIISEQWTNASTKLRKLFNQAGGNINKLEDWTLPQSHDKLKVKDIGYTKWADYIKPKLDIKRIELEQNGNIDDILKGSFDSITEIKVTADKGSKMLANSGNESRVLHFKDGDSLLEYNKNFGNPDVFATMDSFIRSKSTEIATLQMYGANPERNIEKMIELVKADGGGDWEINRIIDQWNTTTGKADGVTDASKMDRGLGMVSGTHRNMKVSSLLGSATISSLADLGTIVLGAGYRGLSSIRILGKGLDTLLQESLSKGTTGANIKLANQIGVVSEFASGSIANSRFSEGFNGLFSKSSEVVIRASGLSAWTDSMRTGFGLELAGNFYRDFGKSFDKLSYKDMLVEYGFTSKDWDIIRKTKPRMVKNAGFLNLKAIDGELGYRFSEMMTNEMNAFIIAPSDRVRRLSTGGAAKGTVKGEFRRSLMLFKSFPVSIVMLHMNRMQKMKMSGKVAYTAGLTVESMIFGSIALFAYDIAKGTTPRDINRVEMIPEALSKSGGYGLVGDLFLGDDKDRYGHSWASTIMGVSAGTLEDIGKTMYEGVTLNEDFIQNAYNRAKNYIPGQNLWYTRTAIERSLGRYIGELTDPKYNKRIRKREKVLKERGQERIEFDDLF